MVTPRASMTLPNGGATWPPPHTQVRPIHEWYDIWACEECGTERTY